MATNIIPFNFDSCEVRVVLTEDGSPWFNANDVCLALELSNPSQAVKSHVDEDDLQKLEVIDPLGRTQQANFVSESGLYALVFGSTKAEAKRFKRWVTSDVLPSIRKTGSYSTTERIAAPGEVEDMLRGCEFLKNALVRDFGVDPGIAWSHMLAAVDTKCGTSLQVETRALLPSTGDFREPTQIDKALNLAKIGRMSATNALLQESGYQIKDASGAWVPTEKAIERKHWIRKPFSKSNGHSGLSLLWSIKLVEELV